MGTPAPGIALSCERRARFSPVLFAALAVPGGGLGGPYLVASRRGAYYMRHPYKVSSVTDWAPRRLCQVQRPGVFAHPGAFSFWGYPVRRGSLDGFDGIRHGNSGRVGGCRALPRGSAHALTGHGTGTRRPDWPGAGVTPTHANTRSRDRTSRARRAVASFLLSTFERLQTQRSLAKREAPATPTTGGATGASRPATPPKV